MPLPLSHYATPPLSHYATPLTPIGIEARVDGYLESPVQITMPVGHGRGLSNPASPAASLYSFVGVSKDVILPTL